jgi:hypothetical protein
MQPNPSMERMSSSRRSCQTLGVADPRRMGILAGTAWCRAATRKTAVRISGKKTNDVLRRSDGNHPDCPLQTHGDID